MAEARPLPGERRSARRLLQTPEGVPLPLELADAGQRAGAFLLDALILGGIFVVMTIALLLIGLAIGNQWTARAIFVLWMLGSFCLRNLYFVWFEARPRGATPGKRVMGLRVIARHGGRLTLDSVIARNALREVEVFLPLTFLGGTMASQGRDADGWMMMLGLGWSCLFLFLPLMNRDRLRAGDLLAGTWVIRSPRPPLLPELTADAGAESFSEADLDAYGVYELETLERVIRQAHPPALETVADTIRARLGRPLYDGDNGGYRDLAFLQAYYAALRGRLEQKLLFGRRRLDKHDRS